MIQQLKQSRTSQTNTQFSNRFSRFKRKYIVRVYLLHYTNVTYLSVQYKRFTQPTQNIHSSLISSLTHKHSHILMLRVLCEFDVLQQPVTIAHAWYTYVYENEQRATYRKIYYTMPLHGDSSECDFTMLQVIPAVELLYERQVQCVMYTKIQPTLRFSMQCDCNICYVHMNRHIYIQLLCVTFRKCVPLRSRA